MSTYKPPLTITDEITVLVSEISEEVKRISVLQEGHITPHLRRKNLIRTIHSSLAIENNTLTISSYVRCLFLPGMFFLLHKMLQESYANYYMQKENVEGLNATRLLTIA